MKLKAIVDAIGLTVITDSAKPDAEVTAGYSGDMLSDVMAHSEAGALWITIQLHINVVAVALFKDLAGVIFAEGRQPETDAVEKAAAEGIALFSSDLSAYEIVGRLYSLGIPGRSAAQPDVPVGS